MYDDAYAQYFELRTITFLVYNGQPCIAFYS